MVTGVLGTPATWPDGLARRLGPQIRPALSRHISMAPGSRAAPALMPRGSMCGCAR
jgi:hypothetical protein